MTTLNVTTAPKTATFQMRINPEIKAEVEKIYARSGMTMTDVFNVVLQRSLTEDSMPVELSPAFHDSMRRAAMIMLTEEVDRRIEASRNERNLLSEEEVLQELGVLE